MVATNARIVSTVKDRPNATSIRIRPCRVLNMPRLCSQIVGTTAGGMIRPASTRMLISGFSGLGRRSRTKAIMAPRTTMRETLATVRIVELMNAMMSM